MLKYPIFFVMIFFIADCFIFYKLLFRDLYIYYIIINNLCVFNWLILLL